MAITLISNRPTVITNGHVSRPKRSAPSAGMRHRQSSASALASKQCVRPRLGSFSGVVQAAARRDEGPSGTGDHGGCATGFQLARRGILACVSAMAGMKLANGVLPPGTPNSASGVHEVPDAAWAATVLGEPITDPRLILRSSLPKKAQFPLLLDFDDTLRALGGSQASQRSAAGSRSIAQSSLLEQQAGSSIDAQALVASLRRANGLLSKADDEILGSVPSQNLPEAKRLLGDLKGRMAVWIEESDKSTSAATTNVIDLKNDLLNISGQMQALLVADAPLVPSEYSSLPQLRGRAVAEIKLKRSKGLSPGEPDVLTVVLDGINAPITAGNFVDLCQKGFYNDMPIQRADGFVVQTGEKGKPSSTRTIPMEVRYEGETEPTYGATKEELGLMRKQVVLPFNAQGTLAMARNEFEANSADTQFFLLNKESEVTPSGANVLDGNYAVFGYVVENQGMLDKIKVDDVIESIHITYGGDHLAA